MLSAGYVSNVDNNVDSDSIIHTSSVLFYVEEFD